MRARLETADWQSRRWLISPLVSCRWLGGLVVLGWILKVELTFLGNGKEFTLPVGHVIQISFP